MNGDSGPHQVFLEAVRALDGESVTARYGALLVLESMALDGYRSAEICRIVSHFARHATPHDVYSPGPDAHEPSNGAQLVAPAASQITMDYELAVSVAVNLGGGERSLGVVDLSNCMVVGHEFVAPLRGSFHGAYFARCTWHRGAAQADLSESRVEHCVVRDGLVDVRLNGARVGHSAVVGVRFDSVDFRSASVSMTRFDECAAAESSLQRARLSDCRLNGLDLTSCDLDELALVRCGTPNVSVQDCSTDRVKVDGVTTRLPGRPSEDRQ